MFGFEADLPVFALLLTGSKPSAGKYALEPSVHGLGMKVGQIVALAYICLHVLKINEDLFCEGL